MNHPSQRSLPIITSEPRGASPDTDISPTSPYLNMSPRFARISPTVLFHQAVLNMHPMVKASGLLAIQLQQRRVDRKERVGCILWTACEQTQPVVGRTFQLFPWILRSSLLRSDEL